MKIKLKRKLSGWLAACGLLTCFSIFPVSAFVDAGGDPVLLDTGTELVIDGGFENKETGSTLNQSVAGNFAGSAANTEVFEATDAEGEKNVYTGSKSAKVTQAHASSEGAVNYFINLEEGKTYQLSAWVRYDESFEPVTQKEGIYIRLAGTNQDTKFYGLLGKSTADAFDGFVRIESTVTIEAGDLKTDSPARINISSSAGTSAARLGETFYIDDVSCIDLTEGGEEAEQPLVIDGGFEEKEVGYSDFSQMGASGTGGIGTYAVGNVSQAIVTDEYAHSGKKSLKLVRDESKGPGQDIGLNYYLSLEEGQTYVLSAWGRYDPNGSVENGGCYIRFSDCEEFAWNDRGTVSLSKTDDFMEFKTTFTAPKDYAKVRLNIGVTGSGDATVYIDDISCVIDSGSEPEPPAADGNLLQNSSFEEEMLPTDLAFANCNTTRTTEKSHTGQYSMKLEQTANYGAANYTVSPTPGKSYYFGGWIHVGEGVSTGSFYVRLFWNQGGAETNNSGLIGSGTVDYQDGWILLAGICEVPVNAGTGSGGRVNIAANPVNGAPVTFYLDDIFLKEVGEPVTLDSVTWNNTSEADGLPVCTVPAEVTLDFSGGLRADSIAVGSLLLNGEVVDAENAEVSVDASDSSKVNIVLKNLNYAKIYSLTLTEENGWMDEFGRVVTIDPIVFKTTGKVSVGSKKLFAGETEITDGKLQSGIIRAEVGQLKNLCGAETNVSAILLLLKDGEMIDAVCTTQAINASENGTAMVTAELNVPDISDGGYQLKLLVWDDLISGLSLDAATVLQ